MRITKLILSAALLAAPLTGCDSESASEIINNLSDGDTVSALKEALKIGASTASTNLGKEGGYFEDEAVKILLPEQAQPVFKVINKLGSSSAGKALLKALDVDTKLEATMTELVNRAAEDAAPKAVDVFSSAITDMSVKDGEGILFGADNAATEYLHDNTYDGLQSAFNPTITASLSNVSVAGMDANEAWSKVSSFYNKVDEYKSTAAGKAAMMALSLADKDTYNQLNSISAVNTNLADYVTGKALDGLFTKVAEKELDIRTNAASRTSDLLKKVFGRLDK